MELLTELKAGPTLNHNRCLSEDARARSVSPSHICLNRPARNNGNDRTSARLASVTTTEKRMTKFGLLGAAGVILSSALASPATAQEVIYNPGYCAQFYPNTNCQNKGPGSPYDGGSYQRQVYPDQAYRDRAWQGSNWRNSYNRFDNSGFWPGDVAAGVVGGA